MLKRILWLLIFHIYLFFRNELRPHDHIFSVSDHILYYVYRSLLQYLLHFELLIKLVMGRHLFAVAVVVVGCNFVSEVIVMSYCLKMCWWLSNIDEFIFWNILRKCINFTQVRYSLFVCLFVCIPYIMFIVDSFHTFKKKISFSFKRRKSKCKSFIFTMPASDKSVTERKRGKKKGLW